MSKLICCI